MFLTKPQLVSYQVARENGYEPFDAVPLQLRQRSRRFNTEVVAVRATKDRENYLLKISPTQRKILSCQLVVIQWNGPKIFDVKKFARPITQTQK